MADVHYAIGDQVHFNHFPLFYEYDPKTRTVGVQDFKMRHRRIPIDEMRFVEEGDTRPAIYYRPSKQLDRFLTLDAKVEKKERKGGRRWGELL